MGRSLNAADPVELIPYDAEKRVLVPRERMNDRWLRSIAFPDSQWLICKGRPGGIGFSSDGRFDSLITLNLKSHMQPDGEPDRSGCYIRIPFDIPDSLYDHPAFYDLTINYIDGCIIYVNGFRLLARNAPQTIAWNSVASATLDTLVPELRHITFVRQLLKRSGNLLAIHALNDAFNRQIFFFNCRLTASNHVFDSFQSSNLPLFFIDTGGRQVQEELRIPAHMGVIWQGRGAVNEVDGFYNHYDGRINIEIRGSSSAGWAKKQYGFETQDDDGSNRNVDMLDCPQENDWILNAPYIDKSLMRNVLAYDLARRMGRYASRTRFCELFLNQEYQGIYVLLEKIKRDIHRIDVSAMDSTDIAGDALTGGYLFKIDKDAAPMNSFLSAYPPVNAPGRTIRYQYHDPDVEELMPQQKTYLADWVHEFETVMSQEDFSSPQSGIAAKMDANSFIDYIILNELAKNVDGYRLSTYFYKDRDSRDPCIHVGPIWDFNLAFGLANYYDGEDTDGWMVEELSFGEEIAGKNDGARPPFWWLELFYDDDFKRKLTQRWWNLRSNTLDVHRIDAFISSIADTLSEAQERNFIIWSAPGDPKYPSDGFWPVPTIYESFRTFDDEVEYLQRWVGERIEWIDEHISQIASDVPEVMASEDLGWLIYPNPSNNEFIIDLRIEKPGGADCRIYNSMGQIVRTFTMPRGLQRIRWDACDGRGKKLANGIYFITARTGHGQMLNSKVLLLK